MCNPHKGLPSSSCCPQRPRTADPFILQHRTKDLFSRSIVVHPSPRSGPSPPTFVTHRGVTCAFQHALPKLLLRVGPAPERWLYPGRCTASHRLPGLFLLDLLLVRISGLRAHRHHSPVACHSIALTGRHAFSWKRILKFKVFYSGGGLPACKGPAMLIYLDAYLILDYHL